MKYPLSIIVITYNEEQMIRNCLESIKWADDIIIVDAFSTDKTLEIAKLYTDRVFQKKWNGYVAAKKLGLEYAVHDWILFLDADELVSENLAKDIQTILSNKSSNYDAYEIPRKAFFLGKWIHHAGWYPGYVVRLLRKDKIRFVNVRVHERIDCEGIIGKLKSDIYHFTDDNIFHYLFKFNKYTSLAAEDLKDLSYRSGIVDLTVRPVFLFFKMYILKLGFLDGIHGLILSCLSSAYVFCKYAKVWEIEKN